MQLGEMISPVTIFFLKIWGGKIIRGGGGGANIKGMKVNKTVTMPICVTSISDYPGLLLLWLKPLSEQGKYIIVNTNFNQPNIPRI